MLIALGLAWAAGYLAVRRWRPASVPTWLALGVLGLAWAGFFWRTLLTPGVTMPAGGGDYAAFYYPHARFAAQELSHGRFPVWNPQVFGGMPFAADPQQGMFYPPNVLWYLLNPELSYRRFLLLTMGHYWLASATCFLLLRGLGVGYGGAILGGICYAYSGFMVAHFGHPPMVAVAAIVPLALLGGWKAGHATTPPAGLRAALPAGVALGVAFLAGHSQIWIYGAVAFTAFALQGLGDRIGFGRLRLPRALLLWLMALGIAGGVAAAQALPFLELARYSVRADFTYERALELALHPVGLIQLVLPKLFGDSPTSFWGPWVSTETVGYAGVVTLALAGAALVRPTRLTWTLAGLGALGVLLALAGETPLHGWAYRLVPGLGQARASGRALYLYDLAVALLAGMGLDVLLHFRHALTDGEQRAGLAALGKITGLAALAAWLIVLPLLYVVLLASLDKPYLDRIVAGLRGGTLLALLLLGSALLLWGLRTGRLGARAATAGLAALAVLDLFSAGSTFNPTTTDVAAGFEQTWAVETMAEDASSFRVDPVDPTAEHWPPDFAMVGGPPDAGGGWNPLILADYYRLWTSLPTRDSRLYDLFAPRYMVIPRADPPPNAEKWTPVADDGQNLALYRNERALPRAFVVGQARVLPREQLWDALHDEAFDPSREVLLEDGQVTGTSRQLAAASRQETSGNEAGGQATIEENNPARLTIEAALDGPGYLVVSDSFYPGWQATVDGVPAPLLRANYALRAVELGPGTHTVELHYRPWTLLAGGAISVLTLLGVGVGLWIAARDGRDRI